MQDWMRDVWRRLGNKTPEEQEEIYKKIVDIPPLEGKVLEDFKKGLAEDWDSLTPEEQQAIIQGNPELMGGSSTCDDPNCTNPFCPVHHALD